MPSRRKRRSTSRHAFSVVARVAAPTASKARSTPFPLSFGLGWPPFRCAARILRHSGRQKSCSLLCLPGASHSAIVFAERLADASGIFFAIQDHE